MKQVQNIWAKILVAYIMLLPVLFVVHKVNHEFEDFFDYEHSQIAEVAHNVICHLCSLYLEQELYTKTPPALLWDIPLYYENARSKFYSEITLKRQLHLRGPPIYLHIGLKNSKSLYGDVPEKASIIITNSKHAKSC